MNPYGEPIPERRRRATVYGNQAQEVAPTARFEAQRFMTDRQLDQYLARKRAQRLTEMGNEVFARTHGDIRRLGITLKDMGAAGLSVGDAANRINMLSQIRQRARSRERAAVIRDTGIQPFSQYSLPPMPLFPAPLMDYEITSRMKKASFLEFGDTKYANRQGQGEES